LKKRIEIKKTDVAIPKKVISISNYLFFIESLITNNYGLIGEKEENT